MFSCSGPDDPVKSGRGCFTLGQTKTGQCVFVAGGGVIGTQRALFTVGADGPPELLFTYPVLDAPGDPGVIRGFTLADDGEIYFPSQKGGDYNLSLIDLEEGPRMLSRVIDVAPDEVTIGMEVSAHVGMINDLPAVVFYNKEQGNKEW